MLNRAETFVGRAVELELLDEALNEVERARRSLVFEGAAVAGDPFDPELAAATAGVPEAAAGTARHAGSCGNALGFREFSTLCS